MKNLLFGVIFIISFNSVSQDLFYTRQVLDTLCSKTMYGRGYLKGGNKKASIYICEEFRKTGLTFFGDNYFQRFSYPVNTFPGKTEVLINGKKLTPARDYYVMARSGPCKGTYNVVYYNMQALSNPDSSAKFNATDFSDKFIVIDRQGAGNKDTLEMFNRMKANPKKAKGIINAEEKISWNVSTKVEEFAEISITKKTVTEKIKTITLDVESTFIGHFPTQNVVGYIEGTAIPDSFIVFTAHYDHLGGMGDSLFIPGANDNASGVSMILNLAKYYKEHPPKYSVVFIAFSGEEAGLLGSIYFTNHPKFPLENIKILLNLDLVGTGEEGIMLVNGAVFTELYDRFVSINNEKNYVKKIDKRGEAKNSDHYPFYAKGVKCFFIYTLGGISEYHNPWDKAETLPLTKYKEVFNLIIDFAGTF